MEAPFLSASAGGTEAALQQGIHSMTMRTSMGAIINYCKAAFWLP